MLFIKIVNIPYYSNLVNKVKTTVAEVKAAIAASPYTFLWPTDFSLTSVKSTTKSVLVMT